MTQYLVFACLLICLCFQFAGWFTLLPGSPYDYNLTSTNNNYTAQNLQNKVVSMVQGKMLGGSSGLHHMMHTNGDPNDYNDWAKIVNDEAWTYTNILPYLKKMENLVDMELLASPYADLHGKDGPLKIARESYPGIEVYLEAFKELGHNIVMDTTSSESAVGITKPLFEIANELRQSSAFGYLGPARSRPNLCLALFTTATKILIEKKVAKGVQVTTSSGDTYTLYANKEVIVSAGAINSPKLLMLSGIGPKEHLESLGIDVVADLPVGENFQDHACAAVVYQMEESNATAVSANPHMFPAPSFNGYVRLDPTKPYATYDTINLLFDHDSSALLQLCINMFKYSEEICQKIYDGSKGRNTLFTLLGLVMPESRGKILLASTDPTDAPIVYTGMFSNSADVTLIAKAFLDHNRLLNTTFFRNVNAALIDLGLCDGSIADAAFWECYAVAMSATMWHYAGTAAMGSVLDSNLRVMGVDSLRVVDASSMPTLIRGKIYAAVMMIAERAADIIRTAWNIA